MTGDDARGPQEVTVVRAAGGTARRSRPLLLALAAIAVLLIGGAVALVRSGGRSTPSYPAAWDPRVSGIVQFVEQHRGMLFEHPVAVRFLPDSQFEKKVSVPQPTSKSDKEALSRALGELRALGLVHGDVNLVASMNSLTQSGVVGLYVYQDKTVYVRGTTMTPFVRVTLAHELTHALQDQHYDLTKVEARMANTDEAALVSLIEGDAIRIQNAYEKTLSPADQQAYQDEQSSAQTRAASPGQVPPILRDMLSFPYIFGPTYIDTLDAGGGAGSGHPGRRQAGRHPPAVRTGELVRGAGQPVGLRVGVAGRPRLAGRQLGPLPRPRTHLRGHRHPLPHVDRRGPVRGGGDPMGDQHSRGGRHLGRLRRRPAVLRSGRRRPGPATGDAFTLRHPVGPLRDHRQPDDGRLRAVSNGGLCRRSDDLGPGRQRHRGPEQPAAADARPAGQSRTGGGDVRLPVPPERG